MSEDNQSFYPLANKPGGKSWLWILLIIIVGLGGYFGYKYFIMNQTEENTSTTQITKQPTPTKEEWTIGQDIVKTNTTSTDTHKISESLYRMYYMDKGEIMYAESNDLRIFEPGKLTGVKEDKGKMISNPAVLKITDTNWIMIYEQQPARAPGQNTKTPPGPNTQRNLYLATSTNGTSFKKVGVAIDSSKEDQYFASVPDLILLPDGKIRMYYVSGGSAIGSTTSADNGKTWTRDSGYRLENQAVDPDVSYKDENGQTKWVMYYSNLDPATNAIYKTTSTDGLTWIDQKKILSATTRGAIIDPDVVEVAPANYVMFLGQSTSGGSTAGEEINLYRAELHQSTF